MSLKARAVAAVSAMWVAATWASCTDHPWNGQPEWKDAVVIDQKHIAHVADSHVDEVSEQLRTRSVVEISPQHAARYLDSSYLLGLIYAGQGRLYLVRALRDRSGGVFRVTKHGSELYVQHAALGVRPRQTKAAALIINLDYEPTKVYATCMAGTVY